MFQHVSAKESGHTLGVVYAIEQPNTVFGFLVLPVLSRAKAEITGKLRSRRSSKLGTLRIRLLQYPICRFSTPRVIQSDSRPETNGPRKRSQGRYLEALPYLSGLMPEFVTRCEDTRASLLRLRNGFFKNSTSAWRSHATRSGRIRSRLRRLANSGVKRKRFSLSRSISPRSSSFPRTRKHWPTRNDRLVEIDNVTG